MKETNTSLPRWRQLHQLTRAPTTFIGFASVKTVCKGTVSVEREKKGSNVKKKARRQIDSDYYAEAPRK